MGILVHITILSDMIWNAMLTRSAILGMLSGVLLLGMLLPDTAHAQVRITDVMIAERSDENGFVLRISGDERISAFAMPEHTGSDVTWTLYGAVLDDGVDLPANGPIQQVEAHRDAEHLTFHLTLDDDTPMAADAYRDGSSDDILLSLSYVDDQAEAVETTERHANNIAQSARERWKFDTIVIDPGHGGKDHGATANGLREKDVVLSVSLKLGEYIEEYLDGVEVLYTRTTDEFLELEERGQFANEHGAKLFLSIHANSAPSPHARGTETYFLGPYKSESAREVMERENSVIRFEEDPEVYDAYDDQRLVRETLTQSTYLRQSQELAGMIEQQFAERVQRNSRGVKQAPFYVLWGASMPAVLIELGFLSNPTEARFLGSEQGQVYMASAIFRAVRDYKEQYERGMMPVAGE